MRNECYESVFAYVEIKHLKALHRTFLTSDGQSFQIRSLGMDRIIGIIGATNFCGDYLIVSRS